MPIPIMAIWPNKVQSAVCPLGDERLAASAWSLTVVPSRPSMI
jgi:hypothetical protein